MKIIASAAIMDSVIIEGWKVIWLYKTQRTITQKVMNRLYCLFCINTKGVILQYENARPYIYSASRALKLTNWAKRSHLIYYSDIEPPLNFHLLWSLKYLFSIKKTRKFWMCPKCLDILLKFQFDFNPDIKNLHSR